MQLITRLTFILKLQPTQEYCFFIFSTETRDYVAPESAVLTGVGSNDFHQQYQLVE